jgi:hypothetical protein
LTIHRIPRQSDNLATSPAGQIPESGDLVDRIGKSRDKFLEIRVLEEPLLRIVLTQHRDVGDSREASLLPRQIERLFQRRRSHR